MNNKLQTHFVGTCFMYSSDEVTLTTGSRYYPADTALIEITEERDGNVCVVSLDVTDLQRLIKGAQDAIKAIEDARKG